MATVRVAAVQASYVLMDQQATLDKVADLTGKAAGQGAQLVAFPEVFIPGSPIWIDTRPIWDGDEAWFRLLAENAVTVPGPATERLAGLARDHGIWLVVGIEERERHGGTIYNTVLYFPRTAPWPGVTASSSRPAPSGPCGAWAMAPRSPWPTLSSAGSEG
jgi:nitrilase